MDFGDIVADKAINNRSFLEKVADKIVSVFDDKPQKEEDDKSVISFFKDNQGGWWFLGIYSNKFEDREDEILSEKSHLEYITWLKETGFKPVVTVLHQPKMPKKFWPIVFSKYGNDPAKLSEIVRKVYKDFGFAEVQRVMYVNGFTVVAARVFPEKINVAKSLSKQKDLGMSHGFITIEFNDNIVDSYRAFEMSVLKRRRAANTMTLSLFAAKEKIMSNLKGLTPDDREFLEAVFTADIAKTLEEGTADLEKTLEEVGLNFKDFTEDDKVEVVNENKPEAEEAADSKPEEEKAVEATETVSQEEEKPTAVSPEMVEAISKAFNMPGLQTALEQIATALQEVGSEVKANSAAVEALKKDVAEVKQTDDERIAAQVTPMFNWAILGQSQSKSKDNLVTEEEKSQLEENAPKGTKERSTPNAFNDYFAKGLFDGGQ